MEDCGSHKRCPFWISKYRWVDTKMSTTELTKWPILVQEKRDSFDKHIKWICLLTLFNQIYSWCCRKDTSANYSTHTWNSKDKYKLTYKY